MKKIMIMVVSIFILLINFNTISYAKSSEESNSNFTKVDNDYIEKYKSEIEDRNSQGENESVDEDMIKSLEYYYNEDSKVLEILKDFYDDENLLEKVVSLEKQDKIDVMYKIKDVYDKIKDENYKKSLLGYLSRYAENSENKELCEYFNGLNKSSTEIQLLAAYNASGAATWAYNNYNKYSSNYPAFTGSFGSDCTNFVSQAMKEGGGLAMTGNWYCYKKNSTYLVPNSASELNYSWTLSDPSPWISVSEFKSFWSPKSDYFDYSHDRYLKEHETIYFYNIVKGDVVLFSKGIADWITVPTHAMIISGYDTVNKDFLLAGHSNPRQAYPLLSAISAYQSIRILHIK